MFKETGRDTTGPGGYRVFEKPVRRISRGIRYEMARRTNDKYGWDSYFIVLGLITDGKADLARSIVDNCAYEVGQYSPNRSQPPFLTSMAIAVYGRLSRDEQNKRWLARTLKAAMAEYFNVWMNRDHLSVTGLSRYRTMNESGHDSTHRLAGCAADLVTVDLNSLLYKLESDVAAILTTEFGGSLELSNGSIENASTWRGRAEARMMLMNRYLWNPAQGMFYDYDFVHAARSTYVSATGIYPLWSGVATKEQARSLLQAGLPLLETQGGIAESSLVSRGPVSIERPQYQWDFPYGWAPHQMLLWQGLMDYGYDNIARRLAYKWLYTITQNAVRNNGTIPENFDVEKRRHDVSAEYGNVGSAFTSLTKEGFGWTKASYEVGLNLLPPYLVDALNRLVPPELVFLAGGKKR